MSGFRNVAPVLPVGDVVSAVAHYRRLGFDVRTDEGGAPYAYARRDEVSLHLAQVDGLDPAFVALQQLPGEVVMAIHHGVAGEYALDAGGDGGIGRGLQQEKERRDHAVWSEMEDIAPACTSTRA